MARSMQWIIVVAAGWEPSEDEKTQFVAEIIESRSIANLDTCSYIPINYARETNASIFDISGNIPLAASFFSVPPSAMQEGQVISSLQVEMPALFSEKNRCEIQSEQYFHPGKKCEVLIIMVTISENISLVNIPVVSPIQPPTPQPTRKMVQQIKGSVRGDKVEPTQRKTLSPIAKRPTSLGPTDQEIPQLPANFAAEKTRIAPTGIAQPLNPIYPPGSDSAERNAAVHPLGKKNDAQEWTSFLQDLDAPTSEPAKQENITARELQPKQQVHRFPKLPTKKEEVDIFAPPQISPNEQNVVNAQAQEGFGEWNSFINQLEVNVKPSGSTLPAPAPKEPNILPSQPSQPSQPPKKSAPPENQEWQSFLEGVGDAIAPADAGAHSPAPTVFTPENQAKFKSAERKEETKREKSANEPGSDSKVFQGRGLFLSAEELALEKAIKKHEQQKPATPPHGMSNTLSKKIVDSGNSFAMTQRRALGPLDYAADIPLVAPSTSNNSKSETRRLQAVPRTASSSSPTLHSQHQELAKPLMEPTSTHKESPSESPTKKTAAVAHVSANEPKPLLAPAKKIEKKRGKVVALYFFLILVTGGAGIGYFYRDQLPDLIQQWKIKIVGEQQPTTVEKPAYEKKYDRAIQNLGDHNAALSYLAEINSLMNQNHPLSGKFSQLRQNFLDKSHKFLNEKVTELLNNKYQFLQATQLLDKFSTTDEYRDFCTSLKQNIAQIALETAEHTSIAAVQSTITSGEFVKALETFRTFNQYQIPQVELKLKALEGRLLKSFVNRYHQENKYRDGVKYLIAFWDQNKTPEHESLKIPRYIVWLIHHHLLRHTEQNQYQLAEQETKAYDQDLARIPAEIRSATITPYIKKFQEQIKEEKSLWLQMCKGLAKLAESNKIYPLEYLRKGNSEKVKGKIILTQDFYATGKFQVPIGSGEMLNLTINELAIPIQLRLVKVSGDMPTLKLAFAFGLYQFSQGNIEEAKLQFSKAGFLQEFDEKLEYYR